MKTDNFNTTVLFEQSSMNIIPQGTFLGDGEEIPPGGWRSYIYEATYRTKDGRAQFSFGFARVGDHVEIDILNMPSYGERSSDGHTTHRLTSNRGGSRVCLGNDSDAPNLREAQKWAAMWSEHTWNYIKYGTPFPNHG